MIDIFRNLGPAYVQVTTFTFIGFTSSVNFSGQ